MNRGKQESDAQRAGAARNKEQGDRGEGKNKLGARGRRKKGRKAPGEVVIARKMAAVGHTVGGGG